VLDSVFLGGAAHLGDIGLQDAGAMSVDASTVVRKEA
jgi:hypothetical protein